MEEQVKDIISKYIKTDAALINVNTAIDRSAVASSIILHRMYARLADEGYRIDDYSSIKTFAQLLAVLQPGSTALPAIAAAAAYGSPAGSVTSSDFGIGVDIEEIGQLPVVANFREDSFYTGNFSPSEIAYCILQKDSLASFTGLFAAKEAIVKADNSFSNQPFNSIIIEHLPGGKPVHPGFQLSISHSGSTAVAVAVKNLPVSTIQNTADYKINPSPFNTLSTLAFLISILTFLLFLFKTC